MDNEQSAIALLLFRVGPVLCCAPADPVQSIIAPPKLTHPPGTSEARPGIFYYAEHVISVSELRHRFGIREEERVQPGRLIITLQDEAFISYWVDEIIEVIDTPKEGWADPPSHLPKGVFTRTLLLDDKIYLFADFANFENLPESGYLAQYIDRLASGLPIDEPVPAPDTADATPESAEHPPTGTETTAVTEAKAGPEEEHTSTEPQPALAEPPIPDTGADSAPVESMEHAPTSEIVQAVEPVQSDNPDSSTDTSLTEQTPDESEQPAPPPVAAPPVSPPPPMEDTPAAAEPAEETSEPDQPSPDGVTTEESTEQDDADPIADEEIPEVSPKPDRPTAEYLKPVPSVVPESERPPPRPPFPWKNLVAALLVFLTLAGIGIYYFLFMDDKSGTTPRQVSQTETAVTPTRVEAPQPDPVPVIMEPAPVTETTPAESSPPGQAQDNPAVADTQTTAESPYHAEIKPDKEGVTIVLHAPDKEPVLKTPPPESEPAKVEDKTAPAVSQKQPATKARTKQSGKKKNKEEIIHIVIKGDTLWDIAEHYVKDPYKYPKLAELSKIRNPDRIYPGNRVRILRSFQPDK